MGNTSLSPGYAKVTYTGTLFPHHMTIPVNYDGTPTPGTEPALLLRNLTSSPGVAAIAAYMAVIKPFFHTTTVFGLIEFHTVDSMTGLDQFIYAADLGVLGTASAANVVCGQGVLTMKATNGRLYRCYLMEGIEPPGDKLYPGAFGSDLAALSAFLSGVSSPVYARGNAYLFSDVSWVTKLNDKLRKQQGKA